MPFTFRALAGAERSLPEPLAGLRQFSEANEDDAEETDPLSAGGAGILAGMDPGLDLLAFSELEAVWSVLEAAWSVLGSSSQHHGGFGGTSGAEWGGFGGGDFGGGGGGSGDGSGGGGGSGF
jgi:hypothetical protein